MQKSLFGKYLRVTMVIVLASFIVLGSVMMFVFSQYTKSDKRKLLMQNASSMASITSVVDITNNGAPELLKVFVRTFSLNIDADISRATSCSVPMPTAPQISAQTSPRRRRFRQTS